MSVDPRAFRDAMGCFATGITVVTTTTRDGRPVGVTVNSFNSVSLDPPLVLFSLSLNATNLQEFLDAGRFTINILGAHQQEISNGFSGTGSDFFQEIEFELPEHGCPLVPEAIAGFECDMETTHQGGDHVIFLGRVRRVWSDPDSAPLLYYRGRYVQLA